MSIKKLFRGIRCTFISQYKAKITLSVQWIPYVIIFQVPRYALEMNNIAYYISMESMWEYDSCKKMVVFGIKGAWWYKMVDDFLYAKLNKVKWYISKYCAICVIFIRYAICWLKHFNINIVNTHIFDLWQTLSLFTID